MQPFPRLLMFKFEPVEIKRSFCRLNPPFVLTLLFRECLRAFGAALMKRGAAHLSGSKNILPSTLFLSH